MNNPRVHIVCPNLTGHDCRVTYIAADGTETDISNVVRAVTFAATVGEVNQATLELVMVDADVEGAVDVTALGDTYHRYVTGQAEL